MQEKLEKIDAIKLTVGNSGKEYYYQKFYSDSSWQRVSKLVYQTCLEYNLAIAKEVEKDSNGRIIFMSYRHERSEVARERHKEVDKDYFAIEEPRPSQGYISIVKKTLGKDGKYYFYESFHLVEKPEDIYWYKSDKSHFDFVTRYYMEYARNIKRNETGEIIWMEYKQPLNFIPKRPD